MLWEAVALLVSLLAAVVLWRAYPMMFFGGKFPAVPGKHWLLGHLELVHRMKEIHLVLGTWAEQYGTCEYFLGNERQLLLTDWRDVETLLKKRPKVMKRPRETKVVVDLTAPGLFSAEIPNWGVERRLVSAAFSHAALASYVPRIRDVTARLMDVLEKKCSGGASVEINQMLTLWTEDIIALVGFGQDLNGVSNGASETSEMVRTITAMMTFRNVVGRIFPYYKIPLVGPFLDGTWRQEWKLSRAMDVVLSRAKKREGPAVTVLDKFIDKNKEENGVVSDKRLKGNTVTMFVAGSDTTATTCSWMFYHLARDTRLQDDARAEALRANLDDSSIFQEISSLFPLLHSVFQEVLRTKGVAAMLTLENPDEAVVVAGKKCLPKEYTFVWPIHHFANRREAEPLVGPHPEVFNPRRWLTEDGAGVKPIPDLMNPFGGGARVCPGRDMALVEILVCTSEALKRFDISLESEEEIPPMFSFGLRPSRPIPVVFQARGA